MSLGVLRVSLHWETNCNKVFKNSSPPSDCLMTSEISYFNSKCQILLATLTQELFKRQESQFRTRASSFYIDRHKLSQLFTVSSALSTLWLSFTMLSSPYTQLSVTTRSVALLSVYHVICYPQVPGFSSFASAEISTQLLNILKLY